MDAKMKARPFSAQPSKIGKDASSPVFKAFRPSSAFSGLQKGNDANNPEDRVDEEKEEEEKEIHSVGCPRYRMAKGPKLSTSGHIEAAAPNPLHPKAWGARDPSMIRCSCFASRNKDDIMKPTAATRTSASKSLFQKGPNVGGPNLFERSSHKEVLNLFDEFCSAVMKKRVKLTNEELQALSKQLMTKLGPHGGASKKNAAGAVKKYREPEEENRKLAVEKSALVEASKPSTIRETSMTKAVPEPGLRNVIGKFYQGRVNLITPTGENYSEEVLQATSIPTYLTTLEGIQPVFPPLTAAALQASPHQPSEFTGYQTVLVRNPSKPQNRATAVPFWRQ